MPLTNEQIIVQLGELHSMNVEAMRRLEALEKSKARINALDTGTMARLDAIDATLERMVRDVPPRVESLERRLENMVNGHSELIKRVALLEAGASPSLDLAIEGDQNKRLTVLDEKVFELENLMIGPAFVQTLEKRIKALEENAHPPARDMIAGQEFETAVGALTTLINDLDTRLRHLDQFCSTLAADVSRVDNKTEPAKDTTAQRLAGLEEAVDTSVAAVADLYAEGKDFADLLARFRAHMRLLIDALRAWVPEGTAARTRLEALVELKPIPGSLDPAEISRHEIDDQL